MNCLDGAPCHGLSELKLLHHLLSQFCVLVAHLGVPRPQVASLTLLSRLIKLGLETLLSISVMTQVCDCVLGE